MKKILLMLVYAGLAYSALAEYRIWSDRKANEVEAEYRGIEHGKVVLLRRDGRTFQVDPAMLSAEDQTYLDQLSTGESPQVNDAASTTGKTFKMIDNDEASRIAQQWIDFIKQQNVEKCLTLYANADAMDDTQKNIMAVRLFDNNIKKIKIGELDKVDHGFDIRIEIVSVSPVVHTADGIQEDVERKMTLWLQLLHDGKIKYDNQFIYHPLYDAMSYYSWALDGAIHLKRNIQEDAFKRTKTRYEEAVEKLRSIGVPLFGLNLIDDYEDQIRSLHKLQDWLEDEGKDWDSTEPKVVCPEKMYNQLKDQYLR